MIDEAHSRVWMRNWEAIKIVSWSVCASADSNTHRKQAPGDCSIVWCCPDCISLSSFQNVHFQCRIFVAWCMQRQCFWSFSQPPQEGRHSRVTETLRVTLQESFWPIAGQAQRRGIPLCPPVFCARALRAPTNLSSWPNHWQPNEKTWRPSSTLTMQKMSRLPAPVLCVFVVIQLLWMAALDQFFAEQVSDVDVVNFWRILMPLRMMMNSWHLAIRMKMTRKLMNSWRSIWERMTLMLLMTDKSRA